MVCAVQALTALVVGKSLEEIVSDFRGFYRLLTSDGQMRWVREQNSGREDDHGSAFDIPVQFIIRVYDYF